MATIADVAENFKALDLLREAQIAMGQTDKQMIDLQIEQRLNEGIDGRGFRMPEYKSNYYRLAKLEAGHNDVTDLTLTGETNRGMFVDVDGENFEISSESKLVHKLERDYGKEIFGLAPNYMERYIDEHFAPKLYTQIEQITGLQMK